MNIDEMVTLRETYARKRLLYMDKYKQLEADYTRCLHDKPSNNQAATILADLVERGRELDKEADELDCIAIEFNELVRSIQKW